MGIAVLFGICFGLIALQLPIAFALITAALAYFYTFSPLPPGIVVQRMAPGLDSFPLLAIPLFLLAGNILNQGGIAARIFEFAAALVGHIRGGLAHVNVAASLIFAGMSGVAQADAAGLGTIEIRAMRREGFDPAFAAAVSAASAVVGPIIPPSVIMVIYGVLAQVSVGDLFLAGIIPGFAIGILLMITIWVLVQLRWVHAPEPEAPSWTRLKRAAKRAFLPMLAPILLTAGLLSGVATPTELGALVVVYAIALGFLFRDLTWAKLHRCLGDTLVASGVLVFIMSAAVPFGWIISINNVPASLAATILSWTDNPVFVLLLINLLLLLVGCIMETTAILLIAVPTFLPLITQLGIDPIQFGLIMILNLLIGATTPPFGVLLFIVQDIAQVSFFRLLKAFWPFYVPLIIALALITYVPGLSLWLPATLKN
ncbi:MAG: TRAP transporter large permease [Hyphomicrobiaceae bacterium]|nr:TRAP transporter large permease [Hyphomicrobiaceae bacterium]